MKSIKISSYRALSLIFTILSTGVIILDAQPLLMGTIQFTKNSTFLPIHIDCGGAQVTTTTHMSSLPKITFEISKGSDQTRFYILVTPASINGKLKESPDQDVFQNTFEYLAVNPGTAYTFYVLDLVKDVVDGGEVAFHWDVKEEKLSETGQIPDKTIIVLCEPDWIKEFKGGSSIEFPTLLVDNFFAEQHQSEEKFKENLVKLELAVLDVNAIHAAPKRKTKKQTNDERRLLIMDLTT